MLDRQHYPCPHLDRAQTSSFMGRTFRRRPPSRRRHRYGHYGCLPWSFGDIPVVEHVMATVGNDGYHSAGQTTGVYLP